VPAMMLGISLAFIAIGTGTAAFGK